MPKCATKLPSRPRRESNRLWVKAQVVVILIAIGISWAPVPDREQGRFQAVYLGKMMAWVRWPKLFERSDSPYTLVILGEDRHKVGDFFKNEIVDKNKKRNGRRFKVEHLTYVPPPRNAARVPDKRREFLTRLRRANAILLTTRKEKASDDETNMHADVLRMVAEHPILATTDVESFFTRDMMVLFHIQSQKLRFKFNLLPVKGSGLIIDPELLALASDVLGR